MRRRPRAAPRSTPIEPCASTGPATRRRAPRPRSTPASSSGPRAIPRGALAEFQIARERGKDSPYRVRAGLEIAHLHRRAQDVERALAAYEAVLTDAAATPGQRDDASYWEGHVYASAKRIEDARRVWQRLADTGEDPLDRIRAWDGIAASYVDAGDLEGAAGALERCREATAEVAAEETRLGERVRRALATMRAVDDLQRAVEKRDGKKSERKLP